MTHGADDGQQDRDEPVGVRATTTSPSPTAWASPPRRSPRSGRSRARTRMPSPSPRTRRPLAAIAAGEFSGRDLALRRRLAPAGPGRQHRRAARNRWSTNDEGPRADTSLEGLAKLRPVFRRPAAASPPATVRRCPTAPARCCWRREQAIKDYGLTPLARFVSFSVAGVRAGSHGHRPDRGDPEGAEAGRPRPRTSSTGSSSTKPSPRRRWR